jgi:hypothetical protein
MSRSSQAYGRDWAAPRHTRFEKDLQRAAAAWFASRGYATQASKPFLLADRHDWHHNIIVPEVINYVEVERAHRSRAGKKFALHKYIHHGLSSQAMLFNLLGPQLVMNDLRPLRIAFQRAGLYWPVDAEHPVLEYEDRSVFKEDVGQPTSIDLALCSADGRPRICIEAKLVESEFGPCSVFGKGDCDGHNPANDFALCYLHRLGRSYWKLLGKHGILSGPVGRGELCHLALHYQFWRECLFALETDSIFVLLYDERSPTFVDPSSGGQRGLWPLLSSFVPQQYAGRTGSISIQQVVKAVREIGGYTWLDEFERKYGLV